MPTRNLSVDAVIVGVRLPANGRFSRHISGGRSISRGQARSYTLDSCSPAERRSLARLDQLDNHRRQTTNLAHGHAWAGGFIHAGVRPGGDYHLRGHGETVLRVVVDQPGQ